MSNILEQYYRQPEIYITIPNNGEFYPPGVLEIPESGEIPVYGMTAKDDIILKTPDALISGEAVAQVIKSCIPAIKDPWQVPATDIDYILVAIRIASYGNEMELEFQCDKCEHEFNYAINLTHYIEHLTRVSFSIESTIVNYGDVKVHIKPLAYIDLSLIQRRSFEEQRALQAVGSMEDKTEEEKQAFYKEILDTMTEINIESISSGIKGIELPDGLLVTDKEEIVAFVNNTSIKLFKKITKTIQEIKDKTDLEPLHIECPECKHEFNAPVIFDYANFFA
jgi:hypothetical protein